MFSLPVRVRYFRPIFWNQRTREVDITVLPLRILLFLDLMK